VQVLTWSADRVDSFQVGRTGQTQTATFTPSSGAVGRMTVTNTKHDMFCPGIAAMGSGSIVVTGGDTAEKASVYRQGARGLCCQHDGRAAHQQPCANASLHERHGALQSEARCVDAARVPLQARAGWQAPICMCPEDTRAPPHSPAVMCAPVIAAAHVSVLVYDMVALARHGKCRGQTHLWST
jgi:hypothetical protein